MIARVRAARRRRKIEAALAQAGAATDVRLAEIPLREMVELIRIDLPSEQMEPLLELGLMPGVLVRFVKSAPLGDPIALEIEGRHLSLRRHDAAQIKVTQPPA